MGSSLSLSASLFECLRSILQYFVQYSVRVVRRIGTVRSFRLPVDERTEGTSLSELTKPKTGL